MSNVILMTFENGKPKRRPSADQVISFSSVKVGASELTISESTGKFAFGNKTLGGIAAAGAAGEAVEYGQFNTALDGKQSISEKGQPNGYPSLDANGVLPTSQLPPLAITSVHVVADEAARFALAGSVEEGDVAIQEDNSLTYMMNGSGDGSLASHWTPITVPGAVASVNGQTGVVSLDSDDVLEGSTNLYFTAARAKAAAVADEIDEEVTDVAPSQAAVHAALALKADAAELPANTDDLDEGSNNLYFTAARAKTAAVADAIVDGVTDVAPSQDAVHSALALKANLADVSSPTETLKNVSGGDITARQICVLSAAGEVTLAEAVQTLTPYQSFYMVKDSLIADDASGSFYKKGSRVTGFSGLTPNAPVYLSRTVGGGIQQDLTDFEAGDHVIVIGRAVSATEIEFDPQYIIEF